MQIRLTAQKASVMLGEPAIFEIVIHNPTSAPLTLDDPAESMEVELHLVDRRGQQDRSYTMGRAVATSLGGADRWALSDPLPKPRELAPNASLRFETDANDRLYLRPGLHDAYLTVGAAASGKVELRVELNRAAVITLLKLAADANQSYGRREWAMDWLAKVKPGFKLALSEPSEPAETRQAREVANRKALEAYVVWWRQQLTRPDLDAELAALK